MSSKSVPLIIFIVVMIALIGGMLLYKKQIGVQPTPQIAQQTQQPTAIPTISNPNALPQGTSDTQLDQDTQTIDQNLTSLDNDIKNVDSGLNDQQTNLQ
jgi:predicted mannosyl-3-phosphoglycerate phosphatase (HAD superfamily)